MNVNKVVICVLFFCSKIFSSGNYESVVKGSFFLPKLCCISSNGNKKIQDIYNKVLISEDSGAGVDKVSLSAFNSVDKKNDGRGVILLKKLANSMFFSLCPSLLINRLQQNKQRCVSNLTGGLQKQINQQVNQREDSSQEKLVPPILPGGKSLAQCIEENQKKNKKESLLAIDERKQLKKKEEMEKIEERKRIQELQKQLAEEKWQKVKQNAQNINSCVSCYIEKPLKSSEEKKNWEKEVDVQYMKDLALKKSQASEHIVSVACNQLAISKEKSKKKTLSLKVNYTSDDIALYQNQQNLFSEKQINDAIEGEKQKKVHQLIKNKRDDLILQFKNRKQCKSLNFYTYSDYIKFLSNNGLVFKDKEKISKSRVTTYSISVKDDLDSEAIYENLLKNNDKDAIKIASESEKKRKDLSDVFKIKYRDVFLKVCDNSIDLKIQEVVSKKINSKDVAWLNRKKVYTEIFAEIRTNIINGVKEELEALSLSPLQENKELEAIIKKDIVTKEIIEKKVEEKLEKSLQELKKEYSTLFHKVEENFIIDGMVKKAIDKDSIKKDITEREFQRNQKCEAIKAQLVDHGEDYVEPYLKDLCDLGENALCNGVLSLNTRGLNNDFSREKDVFKYIQQSSILNSYRLYSEVFKEIDSLSECEKNKKYIELSSLNNTSSLDTFKKKCEWEYIQHVCRDDMSSDKNMKTSLKTNQFKLFATNTNAFYDIVLLQYLMDNNGTLIQKLCANKDGQSKIVLYLTALQESLGKLLQKKSNDLRDKARSGYAQNVIIEELASIQVEVEKTFQKHIYLAQKENNNREELIQAVNYIKTEFNQSFKAFNTVGNYILDVVLKEKNTAMIGN